MHSQRVLTAAILGPLLLALLWWGDEGLFALVLSAVSVFSLYEYYAMVFPSALLARVVGVGLGMIPVAAVGVSQQPVELMPALVVSLVGSVFYILVTYRQWPDPLRAWALFVLGSSYVGFCLAHLALLRFLPLGRSWVIFLLLVVFAGDIGAYYAGNCCGRHKLHPLVSKGKTWEGAFGGLVLNAVAAFLLWFWLFREQAPWLLLFLGLAAGIVGQIGDLAESVVKRSVGVKDSGRLLPGHGGILDRIDAVLLASPVAYWLLSMMVLKQGWMR